MPSEAQRVLARDVLQALGIAPWQQVQALAVGQVAYLPTSVLHPQLARLLAVREVLGLRTPGHSIVKLLAPCSGPAVLLGSYTHPEYSGLMRQVLEGRGMTGLLSRGLEGEVACDPRRQPRYEAVCAGQAWTMAEQQAGTMAQVPGLPQTIDVDTTARYTEDVLAGKLPLPSALQAQLEHVLAVVERAISSECC